MPDRLPLSQAQHGIWTGQQLDPDSPAFNTAEYVDIAGPVEAEVFVAAVRHVVAETPAVRARVVEDDDGVWQVCDSGPQWRVHLADTAGETDPLAAALRWMTDDLARPVDLSADPLFGHALFRLSDNRFVWYHRVHHIALDGYGLALFARRVADVYSALVTGADPPVCEFGSLAAVVDEDRAYLDSSRYLSDRDYWTAYLANQPEPVTLSGRFGPLPHTVLRRQRLLSKSIVAELGAAARPVRALWTEALIASFAAYLRRMSGADEVNLALPVMNRIGSVALRVPCMVLNVVPVRLGVTSETSLTELTGRVAEQIRLGRPHHRYRYEQLRRDLKLVTSDRKMFGPSVNIMPFDYGLTFAGHPAMVRNVSAGLVEDLVLNVYDRADGTGMHVTFDANPATYDGDELEAHLDRFLGFVETVARDPDSPLASAELLRPSERQRLVAWNPPEGPADRQTVGDLFRTQVAATPDAVALVADSVTLTFAQLSARVNRLARLLVAAGAGPGSHVALLLPRTADAVVALLAVLEAGSAYVPIDPDYPAARVTYLLDDSQPVVVLTTRDLAVELPATATADVIVVDDPMVLARVDALPGHDLTDAERGAPLRPDSALSVIYTSGSTGTPKGAVLEHRGMVNLFHHHHEHLISPEVAAAGGRRFRAALTASLSFDTSWEGLLWLLAGHELHFICDDVRRDPAELLRYFAAWHIDFIDITPTYAEELVLCGLLADGAYRPAVIALGGEAVGAPLWTKLRTVAGLSTYNLYGPTECTVDALWCRLSDSPTPVIGRPVRNAQAYVLDPKGALLPPGATGELYLAGTPLGRGYHNRDELTGERFVPNPFGPPGAVMYRTGDLARWRPDGVVEYLGRSDDQVKVRGFRIELAEIEAVLCGHDGVGQAAVTARRDDPRGDRLVAYVVPADSSTSDSSSVASSDLRRYLAARLPDYMVPTAFVMLDRLPANANGKLDRAALPAPEIAAEVARAPRTELERRLCALFAEVLDLPEVGIDDDFFTLGGHSLLVARLLNRVRVDHGVRLGVRAVFDAPTVVALAERIDARTARGTADGSVDTAVDAVDTESDHPWRGIDLAAEARWERSDALGPSLADPAARPRRALLTGATGFLGAFLLDALRAADIAVVCLVRADSEESGRRRLRETLRRYRLADDLDGVDVVAGDLAEPDLGLGVDGFARLAADVDVIYHNGARVNHLDPYPRLRATNVTGTREILRLATMTRLKPVHHVSTCDLAVAASDNPPVLAESRFVDADAVVPNGYVASKWVAEALVRAAGRQGVPTTIHRPSRVSGDTRTGACSTADAFWSMVRAMIVVAAAPTVAEVRADLVPVDQVAAAIVHLSTRPDSVGRTFHLTSPRPVSVGRVLSRLRRRGYDIAEVSAEQWRRMLVEASERAAETGDYTLWLAQAHAATTGEGGQQITFARDHTVAGLAGSEHDMGPLDDDVIDRYVEFFIDCGHFPAPAMSAR